MARTDVPTCRLDESLAGVRERTEAGGWATCVVVNDERVVLGLLREKQLHADAVMVEEAMARGPSTFRPHVPAVELAQYLERHDLEDAPITTGEGVLVGLFRRADAPRHEHEHEG